MTNSFLHLWSQASLNLELNLDFMLVHWIIKKMEYADPEL